jgi:hypothetical protein
LEYPPALPMFSSRGHGRTLASATAPSPAAIQAMQPINIFINSDSTALPSSPSRAAVSLRDFLSRLDSDYSSTAFMNLFKAFDDEMLYVPDIARLRDSDMERLGVVKIGIREILRREAAKYKRSSGQCIWSGSSRDVIN